MNDSNKAKREAPMNETSLELKGDREVIIARTFRAPPRIVFEAWTRADLVKRWWAPKSLGAEVVECTADVRVGGEYRYVTRAGGNDFAFSGKYTEVTRPSKIVYTQVFEAMADAGAVVVTVTFEELGGNTVVVSHEVYPSKEARDGALASGMEHGMRETMNQLDELVASLNRTVSP